MSQLTAVVVTAATKINNRKVGTRLKQEAYLEPSQIRPTVTSY